MNIENKKIVAIYTRVSTFSQAHQGHSLEEQEQRIKAMCLAKDYEVYKVYTDAGISGKDIEHRPAYKRMINDMKSKKFNLIMAYKMDRISRSMSDFEELFNLITKYNCGLELLFGSIDTNGATGMLFARILATFSQFERDIIIERTLLGVEAAVNKGHLGGRPALGYKKENITTADGKIRKVWVIDNEEAKIVREIFDLCLNGKTYFQIAELMRKKHPNMLLFYRNNKKNNERAPVYRTWTDSSICSIINNRHYIGIHDFRKSVKNKEVLEIKGIIPAIISEEIFEECQKNIDRNKRNYYRNKEKQYLFIQKLKCPHCGRILAANGARNKQKELYLYYKCKDCKEYVREDWVEKSMLKKLNDLFEFNLALDNSFIPIDSESAKDFNNGNKNDLRFALDEKLIRDKKNKYNFNKLVEIWNSLNYEKKAEFINQYIDTIEIKKHKYKNNVWVETINFNLRKNKLSDIFNLDQNNLLDKVVYDNSQCEHSYSEMTEKNAYEYLGMLRQKYNIITYELSNNIGECFWDPSMFKKIKIPAKKIIQKDKYIIVMAR